ncbi:MAG: hypothetical protein DRH26_11190 [Deltaproteobacteria bacterium]|nr:MAG: hypothetical protein DRH26_11190 [Deltaproteobacteria bacterium]
MGDSQKEDRVKYLQQLLEKTKIDAAFITLSRDLFYYTGTAQPCIFIVTSDDHRLLVRRAHDFVYNETFIDKTKIRPKGSSRDAIDTLLEMGVPKGKIGMELDVIPATLFLKMKEIYGDYDLVDISKYILNQRMTKDETEIKAIQQACHIMDMGHQRVMETLHPGMTELELAAEIEYAHRKAGHEGILSMRQFDFYISRGPLSAGKNLFRVSGFANTITGIGQSAAVPAGPSNTKINAGDLVITDIPTCYHGYHSDQTRTYILGKPSDAVTDLFLKIREISDQAIFSLKDGITCKGLFEITYAKAQKLGVAEYFLGIDPRKGNFIGHGIGLDANEAPILFWNSDFQLRNNFVLTIEVHLTHPEFGAVKLEDVVLVKNDGCEVLSITPRELFEISI